MLITREEENRNRLVSGIISSAVFALLILILIFWNLVRPNPPFPEGGGGGGQELALGMMNLGNDDVDFGKMGEVTDVVTETTPLTSPSNAKDEILTDPKGEDVKIEEAKNEEKKNVTVVKPVKAPAEKPREKTAAEKLAEKFKKNVGKDGGGKGDNETAGQHGSPQGDPFKDGSGGHGTGTGGGTGDGEGPGTGPGKGPGTGPGWSANLKGRAIIIPPKLPSDTKEEGKVVVEITVDNQGNVTEANPNGRGTTTSSPVLKEKARKVALSTKFNVDSRFEEQRGTITIVFAFQ